MKFTLQTALRFALFALLPLAGTTTHAQMMMMQERRMAPNKNRYPMPMMKVMPMKAIPDGASPEAIQKINDDYDAAQQKITADYAKAEKEALAPYYAEVKAYNAETIRNNEDARDNIRKETSQALIQENTKAKIAFLKQYLTNQANQANQAIAELNQNPDLIAEISGEEIIEVKNRALGKVIEPLYNKVFQKNPELYQDLKDMLTTTLTVSWLNDKVKARINELLASPAPVVTPKTTPEKAKNAKKVTTTKNKTHKVKKTKKKLKKPATIAVQTTAAEMQTVD